MKLPKKVNRAEAKVDGKVAERLAKMHPFRNWVMEVKMKGGKLKEHQKRALRQVENGKFTYKIPDMGRTNPFDYIHLGDADAIVCVVDGKDVQCDVNGGTYEYKFKIK